VVGEFWRPGVCLCCSVGLLMEVELGIAVQSVGGCLGAWWAAAAGSAVRLRPAPFTTFPGLEGCSKPQKLPCSFHGPIERYPSIPNGGAAQ
jgi:hypothetical protein